MDTNGLFRYPWEGWKVDGTEGRSFHTAAPRLITSY